MEHCSQIPNISIVCNDLSWGLGSAAPSKGIWDVGQQMISRVEQGFG